MTRAETTERLSRMAEERLRRLCTLWAPEVDLGDGRDGDAGSKIEREEGK